MINGTNLALEPIAGSGASRGGMIMGAETGVIGELVEVKVFPESNGVQFCEDVMG